MRYVTCTGKIPHSEKGRYFNEMVITLGEVGEAISENQSSLRYSRKSFLFRQIIAYVTIEVSVIGGKWNDETS